MTFSDTILQWYSRHKRMLPWRDISDSYLIWLSEIILQQTQVAQGRDYYLRFATAYPTVEKLAAAPLDDVLRLWQGLGYYSRARNLHRAAQQVVALGHFPQTYEEVRAMHGVGPYTAAAICSIAYGLPVAVVDGNVYRVLSRYFGVDTPIDTTAGQHEFAALADELLDKAHPGTYNQGLMDFGALQCRPASPDCAACPLADSCAALASGRVDALPVKAGRTKQTNRYFVMALFRTPECFYLRRRGAGDIWQGLYEPHVFEFQHEPTDTDAVRAIENAAQSVGHDIKMLRRQQRHVLTHRRLFADFYEVRLDNPLPNQGDFLKIPLDELSRYGVSRLVELLYEAAGLIEKKANKKARLR